MEGIVSPWRLEAGRKTEAFLLSLTLHFHCPDLLGTPFLLRCPLLILSMYYPTAIPQETFTNARHWRH